MPAWPRATTPAPEAWSAPAPDPATNTARGGLVGASVGSGGNSGSGSLVGADVASPNNSGTGGLVGAGVSSGNNSGSGSLVGAGVASGQNTGKGGLIGAGIGSGRNSGDGSLLGAGVASGTNSGQGGIVGTQVPGSNSTLTVTPGTIPHENAANLSLGSNNTSVDVPGSNAVSSAGPGPGRAGATPAVPPRRPVTGALARGGCCHGNCRIGGLERRRRQCCGHGG